MSYYIDKANREINTIDRKILLTSIPVIISILIAFGLGADAVNRILKAFTEDDRRRDGRNNAINFNRDLDSFSDSDNAAGLITTLEDELSTVVSFEPKLPELRAAMATLFNDFNENISDWDENEIPNVEAFKERIGMLTANLDAVSDENLFDVLRLVKDEIDAFGSATQVWVSGLSERAFDLSQAVPVLEVLGGILLVLGTIAATDRRRNKLVQERYAAMESKIDAIKDIVEFQERPTEIRTYEDVKLSVLNLLLEMRSPDKPYNNAIRMRIYPLSRIISHIHEMDAASIGAYINTVKEFIVAVYDNNYAYSYSFDAAMELRQCMDRVKYIEQKYKSIKAKENTEVAPVIEPEDSTRPIKVNETHEEEPTMLRVIKLVLDEKVNYLLALNNKLAVNTSTLAFSQSISNSYKSFCEAVPTNNLEKAIHYIKKMLNAVHRLMNVNNEAAKLFTENRIRSVIAELESFHTALSEKQEA